MTLIDRMNFFTLPANLRPENKAVLPEPTSQETSDSFVYGEPEHDAPLSIWRNYIEFLQRLKTVSPSEYDQIPAVLKNLTLPEIQSLKLSDIEALQAMNALPQSQPETLNTEQVLAAQSYIRMLRRLNGNAKEYAKVPAILRTLSEDEVETLTPESAEALKLLGAFPETLFHPSNSPLQELNEALIALTKSDRELAKLANMKDAIRFASHPAVVALLKSRPDLQRVLNEDMEKKLKAYFPSAALTIENHPYETHPYGEETAHRGPFGPSGNLSILGKLISGNLEWLLHGL